MLTKARIAIFQSKDVMKKSILCVLIICSLCFSLHPGRFASSYYSYIKHSDIANELEPSPLALALVKESDKPLCLLIPRELENTLQYPNESVTESDIRDLPQKLNIEEGGTWKPKECISQHQVAIVIPFRNRTTQLQIFLSYMHPFLQKQMLNYRIFVIEQATRGAFNRAKLLNIGYAEALKTFPYHCFIFHDVDLIPQKLSNIYGCTHQPRHMSSSLNTFRYNLPYQELFGGAVAILQKQFELVNGFSNIFFGWGGEDDDFQSRINNRGMTLCRFPPDIARYMMLAHAKELPSENRFLNLRSGRERFETDGVNTLRYTVIKLVYYPLYTWVLVDL
ncbi:beta-1,4-N-acetylgalactosaminyltransferase bre-4-like [Periplaneta americana]|uniref:beta-1,4-N-acetylgalactosaminyltransferase bre-4-like n=1 Tax=Periplaneta americana TaxID=6978 RepID=UPI0037E95915